MENSSSETSFILTGFDKIDRFKSSYFAVCLIIYLLSSFANVLLISIIVLHEALQEPMYIFVCNLCINGIYGSTTVFPKLLVDILSEAQYISYIGCFIQTYCLYIFGFNELSLLALMAYDRYVSICNPLRYASVMTKVRVRLLLLVPWLYSFCLVLSCISPTLGQPVCSKIIQDIYCNTLTFLKLSCSAGTVANIFETCISISNGTLLIAVIIYSYVQIFRVSFKVSGGDKAKALNTCMTHLLLLFLYFISGLFAFLQSRVGWIANADFVQFFMSVSCLIIPAFFNPLIYGIRTQEIRKTIQKLIKKMVSGSNVTCKKG
ncbi:olfactory receptor 4C12-like [Protopterus annectens]|uniref:olfactory receptor 4C12-like n=1 Tax=Protopterus annectens TaxID=7888 RepID=UPI001CFA12A3|nr:olfactory receptor 4C12-like [Protopterus annectens]